MAALDTNILVRFLVEDDQAQLDAARKLIRKCVNAGETLYVPVTVALELEWVLRSNFGFTKPEILRTFSQLLMTLELVFESERALELGLMQFAAGRADFSDCLHVALAACAGEEPLWTFDQAASQLEGARLLKP